MNETRRHLMPMRNRAFLIALAVAFAIVVFCLGTSFTYSAESAGRTYGAELFWLLVAIVFASPMWIPAMFATRSGRAATAVRLLSAGAMLVPLWYAGAVVFHQAQLFPYPLFSISIFAVAAILSAGFVAAIAFLLFPNRPVRFVKRREKRDEG